MMLLLLLLPFPFGQIRCSVCRETRSLRLRCSFQCLAGCCFNKHLACQPRNPGCFREQEDRHLRGRGKKETKKAVKAGTSTLGKRTHQSIGAPGTFAKSYERSSEQQTLPVWSRKPCYLVRDKRHWARPFHLWQRLSCFPHSKTESPSISGSFSLFFVFIPLSSPFLLAAGSESTWSILSEVFFLSLEMAQAYFQDAMRSN